MTLAPPLTAARSRPASGPPAQLAAARQAVSVVVPAYNESAGIRASIEELLGVLSSTPGAPEHEVIVVDDGSTDDTDAQARTLTDPRLTVLRHGENRGYGAAIKTGIRHARHDWIAITDADGTYPARYFPTLFELRERGDMVVGARVGANVNVPLLRRPPKWVLRQLATFLIQRHIPDLNSGMRVMRRDVVERYERLLPNQFSFTTTITLVMLSAGYGVHFEPIDYLKRKGRSKIRPFHDMVNFFTLILRTVLYFNPLRVFIPVSALFVLASLALGFGSYAVTGTLMDVTTVLLFVTGVQLLALGMLADLVNRRSSP